MPFSQSKGACAHASRAWSGYNKIASVLSASTNSASLRRKPQSGATLGAVLLNVRLSLPLSGMEVSHDSGAW